LLDNPPLPAARARTVSANDLVMLIPILIWGINFSVLKVVLRDMSPLAFNAVRFSLATVVMLIVLRVRGESYRLAPGDFWPVVLLGLIGHTFYQIVFINGVARTSPGNASLLMATAPIFVVIFGRITGIERTNRITWLGIVTSFFGIALFITGGGRLHLDATTLTGDLLVLGASALWAAYTTGSKPLLAHYSPIKLTGMSMLFGTIPLVLVSIPAVRQQDWGAVSAVAWAGLIYSAVLSVAVAYVIWYTSVQRVGNARTAVFSNLTPVVGAAVAWIALGETFTLIQIVGAAIVLSGLMITRRGRAR
jgi:drug/metabolite transporter (DMT)-like permease